MRKKYISFIMRNTSETFFTLFSHYLLSLFQAEALRKKRISNHFMSFFSRKEKTSQPVLYQIEGPFRPFQIKEGMTVAPIHRRPALSELEHKNLLNALVVS